MAIRHVEANMDVTLSNLTSILPRPKFGKRGVPVVKARNCVRVSCDPVCKNSIRYPGIHLSSAVIVCGNSKTLIISL